MTQTPDLMAEIYGGVREIPAADWDACACPEAAQGGRPHDPFTTHRFLAALEASGSVGPGTGWQPVPITIREGGSLRAAAPFYAKSHSYGEYVFDHAWADAYARARRAYYPKLQLAVPFTPATGRRFLAVPGFEGAALPAILQAAQHLAEQNTMSSLHATFCTLSEAEAGAAQGLIWRRGQQFHWENRGYADFDAFLADLSSRKRKAIRKERATAQAFGGTIRALTGDQIEPAHWDAFWTFYQDTGARKWGRPYLTRAFFHEIHATMRADILLVLAEREGRAVAGALNFIGRDTLYGRYWGAVEHHPCLHFELCYYQAIDHAIAQGMARVEAGAQGEHKLARGYMPTPVHSLHWMAHPAFHDAIAQYVVQEAEAVAQEIEYLADFGPFRKGETP